LVAIVCVVWQRPALGFDRFSRLRDGVAIGVDRSVLAGDGLAIFFDRLIET